MQPGPGDATGRSRETHPFVRVLLPHSDPYWAKNTIGGLGARSPSLHRIPPFPQVSESTGQGAEGWPVNLEGQTGHSLHKNALTQLPNLKGTFMSLGTSVGELWSWAGNSIPGCRPLLLHPPAHPGSMTHTLNTQRPSCRLEVVYGHGLCIPKPPPLPHHGTICSRNADLAHSCMPPLGRGSGSPCFQGASSEENIAQQACARKHTGEEDACAVLQGSPAGAQRGKKEVLPSSLQFRLAGPSQR